MRGKRACEAKAGHVAKKQSAWRHRDRLPIWRDWRGAYCFPVFGLEAQAAEASRAQQLSGGLHLAYMA